MKFFSVHPDAELIRYPFSYYKLKSAFSNEVIKLINEYYPSTAEFAVAKSEYGKKINQNRKDFWLTPPNLSRLDIDRKGFWFEFMKYLNSEQGISYFSSHLVKAQGGFEPQSFFLIARLCEEELPYVLPPHIDQDWKLFTCIVYLDSDCVNTNAGTTIYTKQGDFFEKQDEIAFTANAAVMLINSVAAWHGGDWDMYKGKRRTLQMFGCNSNLRTPKYIY